VFILRLRLVQMIDASGAAAFTGFLDRAHKFGIKVVPSGLQSQPRAVFQCMRALAHPAIAVDVPGFEQAVPVARALVGPG
jgi:SulP family sulfate permease